MSSASAPSRIWLILGIVMIVLALLSGYAAIRGASTMKSGGQAFQEMDTSKSTDTHIPLTVPGTTSADLEVKSYVISLHGADFINESEDEPGGVDYELPEVTWEISGPAPAEVSHGVKARMNDVVRAGQFEITQAGTYEITATLPEGATNSYSYSIEDNPLAVLGEAAGALGQAAGGLFMMAAGAACGSLFGILGIIFLIVHFVKGGKPKEQMA